MCSVAALRWSVRGTEASQPVLPPELTALGRTGQTWRVLGHGSKGVRGTDTEWALTVGRRQVRSPRPPACLSPKGVGTGCEAVSGLFEGQRPRSCAADGPGLLGPGRCERHSLLGGCEDDPVSSSC